MKKTICFTGLRPEKMPLGGKEKPAISELLYHSIRIAAQCGYTQFISGVCRGLDLWAAEQVLCYREAGGLQSHNIRLICAIPFPRQAARWSTAGKTAYDDILAQCNEQVTLSDHYSEDCYYERNRYMVDRANLVIAYWDGTAGGTAMTVRYAKKQGKPVMNLHDYQTMHPVEQFRQIALFFGPELQLQMHGF